MWDGRVSVASDCASSLVPGPNYPGQGPQLLGCCVGVGERYTSPMVARLFPHDHLVGEDANNVQLPAEEGEDPEVALAEDPGP